MGRAGIVLLFFLLGIPLFVSGQQSASTELPLVVTDKQAVEQWSKTIFDGQLDPKLQGDTAFLLSLSPTEMLGRFRFKQRCALCHAPQANNAPTFGPVLTQKNAVGREELVRRQILEGSNRMPGFKLTIDTPTVDAIIAYLKKVETVP
jgi:cytochrome c5